MNGSRPIRVVHLGSPTGLYGAERWILALVKFLPDSVDSIVSVLRDRPEYDAALCTQAAKLGLRTHIVESHGRLSFSAISKLRRFVKEHKVDILHTHGYKTDLIGRLATLGTECRMVSTPHGWSADAGPMLQIYEALDRRVFPFMDAVAPLSEDLHRELAGPAGSRKNVHLIRNGVDLSEVDAAPSTSPELQALKRAGCFLVGYIGQLIPRKGIDCLIRAFAAMSEKSAHLCLVGEGPQRADLEQLAVSMGVADRTTFFGYRSDRLTLLKQFDAFVLPSSLEGIPRCVMESMGARVAVVGTDIPGTRDIVRDGQTGILFPVGDTAALSSALDRLSSDPQLRSRLAGDGEKLVRAEYSAQAMAARYVELYRSVVGGPSQRVN